jgi:hypothetical protein
MRWREVRGTSKSGIVPTHIVKILVHTTFCLITSELYDQWKSYSGLKIRVPSSSAVFFPKTFLFDQYLGSYARCTPRNGCCFLVQYYLLFSGFNEIENISSMACNTTQYPISWKSVQSSAVVACREIDRHEAANRLIVASYRCARAENYWKWNAGSHFSA